MPAEAIVFLHGNLSRGSHWQPQLDALAAEGWRLHAPDQRGFGDPPAPGRPDSLLDLADDVAAWCAAERLDAVSVVGMSFGGSVAQAVAVRHPEIVHSLLLAGAFRLDELHPAIAAFNAPAIEHGVPPIDTIGPMVRASFSDRYQAAHPDVVDRIVDELHDMGAGTNEGFVRADDLRAHNRGWRDGRRLVPARRLARIGRRDPGGALCRTRSRSPLQHRSADGVHQARP